jgi:hypothetical protein
MEIKHNRSTKIESYASYGLSKKKRKEKKKEAMLAILTKI